MEGEKMVKTEAENRERVNNPLSFHTYPLTMLSITEISCTSSPCLCLLLMSRILMLMELITCGVSFFQYVHPNSKVCWGVEERWESIAEFDGGGKLEKGL